MDSLFFPPYSKLIRFFHEQRLAFAIFDASGDLCYMNANFSSFLRHNHFDDDSNFSLFHTLNLDSEELNTLAPFDTYTFDWPFNLTLPPIYDHEMITCTLQKDIQYYYFHMELPPAYCVHLDYLLENTPLIDAQSPFTLASLFEQMDIALCLCELVYSAKEEPLDFYIRFVNPAFEQLVRKPKSELVGICIRDLCSLFEESWFDALDRCEKQNAPILFTKYLSAIKAYWHISISPSHFHHFLITCQDVTDQIRAEQTLAQSDKITVIGQLAGGIAHDFNNQLQIMQSYGDLMSQHLENHPDTTMSSYLNSLLSTVSQSSTLIHQLLNYSRDVTAQFKPIHLNDVLHNVKNIFAVSLQKNVHLHLLLEAINPIIQGDSALIQNALLNLCINSRDALSKGGIIRISTRIVHYDTSTYVGLQQLTPGDYVCCSVWDNGDGIETEDLYTIFEPFFTTKASKGTGMGLSAVCSMIKHHHGAIDVRSVRHEWTQFDLYFPILDAPFTAIDPIKTPKSYVKTSYRIILVDDESVLTQVISSYLETEGHIVQSYTDPQQLLNEASKKLPSFDMGIFDMLMPKMNGFELLRQLSFYIPDIKCIFLSGASTDEEVPEALAPHVLAQIKKPVNLHDLHATIQRLLHSTSISSND